MFKTCKNRPVFCIEKIKFVFSQNFAWFWFQNQLLEWVGIQYNKNMLKTCLRNFFFIGNCSRQACLDLILDLILLSNLYKYLNTYISTYFDQGVRWWNSVPCLLPPGHHHPPSPGQEAPHALPSPPQWHLPLWWILWGERPPHELCGWGPFRGQVAPRHRSGL